MDCLKTSHLVNQMSSPTRGPVGVKKGACVCVLVGGGVRVAMGPTIQPGAVRSMTTDKLASFSLGGTK